MPDEHLPQERVFLAYAASPSIWKDLAEDVNRSVALLARTIARYQPVTLLCRPAQEAAARRACGGANIDYLALPLDDIWVRDYGGCFVLNGEGEAGLVDFNFNGWGGKQQAGNDSRVAGVLSRATGGPLHRQPTDRRGRRHRSGRAWHGDPHRKLLAQRQSQPRHGQGPGRGRMKALLGLRKIVWLPGIRGRDITDAHVDFYARFVRPGVVIANLDNDPDSYDYAVTREHLEILRTATDADGRALQVHTLSPPLKPRRDYSRNNPDFAAGYINYLPINGAVIARSSATPAPIATAGNCWAACIRAGHRPAEHRSHRRRRRRHPLRDQAHATCLSRLRRAQAGIGRRALANSSAPIRRACSRCAAGSALSDSSNSSERTTRAPQ